MAMRSREQINEQVLTTLKKRMADLQVHHDALKKLLINELAIQREADWQLKNHADYQCSDWSEDKKIEYALDCLEKSAEYNSVADYLFSMKWNTYDNKVATPFWAEFVDAFPSLMGDSSYKVACEYEEKFGLVGKSQVVNPKQNVYSQTLSVMKNESKRKHKHAVHKKQQKNAFDKFCEEVWVWNTDNLCRVFLEYLAGLPLEADFESKKHQINNIVIPELVKHVIDKALSKKQQPQIDQEFLYKRLTELVEILELIRANSTLSGREKEKDVLYVKEIYKQQQLICQDQPVAENESAANPTLFRDYVEQLKEIYQQLFNSPKFNQHARSSMPFVSGGAGGGLLLGMVLGAIIIATSLAALSIPLIMGVIVGVALVAASGAVIGLGVKKWFDHCDQQVEVISGASIPIKQAYSTTICALFLGLGCCGLADANAQDPLDDREEQSQSSVCDYDARKEVGLAAFSVSGTKVGPSSPK